MSRQWRRYVAATVIAPLVGAAPVGPGTPAAAQPGFGTPAAAPDRDDWTERARLTASDGKLFDQFGIAVAVDGDTALVAANAPFTDTGAVYVYTRDGDSWSEQAKLVPAGADELDQVGVSVALAGDTALIGANGTHVDGNSAQGVAYVFTRDGGDWQERATLLASDGAAADNFGFSVALSGDTALVGSPRAGVGDNPNQGAVYVFTGGGDSWSERAKLTSDTATGEFGGSVGLDRDTAVVGSQAGAAWVFARSGGTWHEESALAPSGAEGRFGTTVAVDGDHVVVGAPGGFPATAPGAAYLFARAGGGWVEQARLTASDGFTGDRLGTSVALHGDTVLAGANRADANGDQDTGAAYVFIRNGGSWSERAKLAASDGETGDHFGRWVAVSGDTAVVGAFAARVDGNENQGLAYVFTRESGEEEPDPTVCDRTLVGVHMGPLTVAEGTTCLAAGAQVHGEVNVLDGAGLVATAAVVQGPVSAVGATMVELSVTQVTGPVLVSGATHTVWLFGNQVTGSVSLLGNSTGSPAVVAGNTVIGSLVCLGNQPEPTGHGLPNLATAGRLGQCAAR